MRTIGPISLFLLIVMLISVGTYAAENPAEKPKGVLGTVEARAMPESYFHKAYDYFREESWKASAEEIRKGVSLLKREAARATGKGKEGLLDAASELEKLADDVEKGIIDIAKVLKHAFARAHYALASNSLTKASEAWSKKEIRETGIELKLAATPLENAATWAGEKLPGPAVAAVDEARSLSGKMIEGMGWSSEGVGKTIGKLGTEIDAFGKKIQAEKKAEPLKEIEPQKKVEPKR